MHIIKNKGISLLKHSLVLGVVLGALANVSVAAATTTTSKITKQKKVSSKDMNTNGNFFLLRMGSGYDSVTQTATSGQSCLTKAYDKSNITIGNPVALMKFEHEKNIDDVEKALGVHVTGNFGGDRFGFSMEAKFANDSKDSNYSTNLRYITQYAGKAVFSDLGHGIEALRPSAAEILLDHPTDFRAMCGDRFVEQMDAGATLVVNLALNFNSRSDKERFDSQLKADVGLASISSSIQLAAAQSHVHVELNISAIQQGGEPQKLNQIFGDQDSSGVYPIFKCQSGNGAGGIEACDLAISNIVAYGQTLKTQLTRPDGSLYLDRLYYTNPSINDYKNIGVRLQGAPNPSSEILQAMAQLSHDFDTTMENYIFVTHYITALRGKLDTPTLNTLKAASEKLKGQIYYVYLLPAYDVSDCYRGYVSERCLIIRDNVEVALKRYQLTATQNNIIEYLKTNSYHGKIINYFGNNLPKVSDYSLTSYDCIFAPVSSPYDARYAIYCDGKWLATADTYGVGIKPGFMANGLIVSELDYFSVSPNNLYGQWIKYKDTSLKTNPYYDNYFEASGLTVTAPQYNNSNANLKLIRSYQNEA